MLECQARLLLPRRRLAPRTYRIGAGQTLLIGGVGRLDVVEAPAATIYLTVRNEKNAANCLFGAAAH